ncbi:hypothetical protein LCGC14_2812640 [marine sediment metagenome]|uniref:Uncharacterized protein n=1 Tax=marine sediment metagenome TaxID=412755 RepID=A0A0F9ASV6_9ZZZZ
MSDRLEKIWDIAFTQLAPDTASELWSAFSENCHDALTVLEAENEQLREALTDIKKGMAPPDVMAYLDTESPELFRGRMWSWSQKRARDAIKEK